MNRRFTQINSIYSEDDNWCLINNPLLFTDFFFVLFQFYLYYKEIFFILNDPTDQRTQESFPVFVIYT